MRASPADYKSARPGRRANLQIETFAKRSIFAPSIAGHSQMLIYY